MMSKIPDCRLKYLSSPLVVFVSCCLALFNNNIVQAKEDVGCLFCHQYPGLVRLNEDKTFRVFHIDTTLYKESDHGKLSCKECHADIATIPHINPNKVDCQSSQCHQAEKDKPLLTDFHRQNIHKGQQSIITHMPDQTSCKVCHPIYPHSKEEFMRSFLNMHTSYITCEVCHLKRKGFKQVEYEWISTKNVTFQGEPFGSFYDADEKRTQSPQSSISRIVPFLSENGVKKHLISLEDTEKAKEFIASGPITEPDNMKLAMKYYHRNIGKLKTATACDACHTTKGLIDFEKLGFSKERVEELTTLNVDAIISKYRTFYMPKIY